MGSLARVLLAFKRLSLPYPLHYAYHTKALHVNISELTKTHLKAEYKLLQLSQETIHEDTSFFYDS